MEELRNMTKGELTAHYGKSLRQSTPEELAEWYKVKAEARRLGVKLPSDDLSFGGDMLGMWKLFV